MDEQTVRKMIRRILVQQGYEVITATDGVEALQIVENRDRPFDLVVTDMIMPQLGGKKMVEILRETCPGIKVLFISGYTDNAIDNDSALDKGMSFMQKPFLPNEFAARVREMLDMD